MANYFNLPFLLPFKFYKSTQAPGMHFDDSWACEQVRKFERKVTYKQKWIKTKTTKLQCESSIIPNGLRIINQYGTTLKTINWVSVYAAVDYSIYELTFDVSDLADQTIYLYQLVQFLPISWPHISEPIQIGTSFENLRMITYKHSSNKDDVSWSTGLRMNFMCEWDIQDFVPESETTSYINEMKDAILLDGIYSRMFQLNVGDAPGVAPYIVDILARIMTCDYTVFENKRYTRKPGSEFKVTRVKGYPLIGASLDILESDNLSSLQSMEDGIINNGIITTFNIETGFFGPAAIIPIIEVEQS